MGRIKTKLIKRKVEELLVKHPKEFTKDFNKNKVALDKLAEIPSTKLRNVTAGYITKVVKRRSNA